MIKELVYAVKCVLGEDLAGRDFTVFPDDTFIVSYPRSGNTWARFLVANLLHPQQPVTFANIEQLVPDIHAQSKRFLKRLPRPRVIKSHTCFDPRYKKVIYIVRDPRDVVVSAYHFHRKQRQVADAYPIESYVNDFICASVFQVYASWAENVGSWLGTRPSLPRGGAVSDTGRFGSWGENVGSWLMKRQNSKMFLLLRYEDMMRQPETEVAKLADLLGLHVTSAELSQAIAQPAACRSSKGLRREFGCSRKTLARTSPLCALPGQVDGSQL